MIELGLIVVATIAIAAGVPILLISIGDDDDS